MKWKRICIINNDRGFHFVHVGEQYSKQHYLLNSYFGTPTDLLQGETHSKFTVISFKTGGLFKIAYQLFEVMAELFSYHEDSNDNFFYNIKIDLFYLIFNDLPPTNCSCRKNSLKQYIYFTISLINYNQLGQFCCYQVKESLLCGHAQSLASLQRRPTAKR